MSLFRKPRKAIQRRVFSEQDDEEPMELDAPSSTISGAPKPEKDTPKKKDKVDTTKPPKSKQSLLSFETEEEGEVFQVKKSSHSKKLMRMYEKERKKKEAKDQKSAIKEEDVSRVVKDKLQEIITDDLVLVVNTNHKEPPPPPVISAPSPPRILSGRDALCAGKDDLSSEEEDDISNHRFSKPENVKKVLESGNIPDAAMIHAARKRRQRAREQGDFIPVEEVEEEPEKPKDNNSTGRLVREDEHEGSDEDRIDMGANPVKRDQERRREQFYGAQDSDNEKEDEINEWEDQQIRKGVTGVLLNQDILYNSDYNLILAPTNEIKSLEDSTLLQIPKIESDLPKTPQAIVEKLKEHYANVISSRDEHKKQLRQVQTDLIQVAEELESLKIEAPKAAQRFRFYQELRGYITDLVECLDEKISVISELETKAMDTMSKRSEWLIERRRQDVRDQADEIASVGKHSLGRRTTTNGSSDQSTTSTTSAEDEEKLRRAVEREGRRTRRRRARETASSAIAASLASDGTTTAGAAMVMPRHVDGMSSDEEIPPQESLVLAREREGVEQEARGVLEDVVDDYSTVANILIKFEQWRETDAPAYNDAYATLCIPKIVSPLVRLNLIFWDPLNESIDLEKMDWYRTLALYGLHDDETEQSLAQDPDVTLLPTLMDRLITPKITQFIDRCWDPLSTSQTLRLVGLVGRLVRRFPTLSPDSAPLRQLFEALLHRIRAALEHDVFVPVTGRLLQGDGGGSRAPFFQRQFASALKLLRNVTCWQGVIGDGVLVDLALNKLLNRYLLSGIKICQLTDAVSKIGLISHILPRVWLQNDIEQLQLFNNCVVNLAQQLDKNNPLHLEPIDTLTNILKSKRM